MHQPGFTFGKPNSISEGKDAERKTKEHEKENAETKKFLDSAIWTSKKGKTEHLFAPITTPLTLEGGDQIYVYSGGINKWGTVVSTTSNTVKIKYRDNTEQEIDVTKQYVFLKQ
jgi:hypothetical protein